MDIAQNSKESFPNYMCLLFYSFLGNYLLFSSSHVLDVNWTVKKAESQRIDAFNCDAGEDSWESLRLQGESNQSILKEISPGCSLEGLIMKLKLQSFGPPDANSRLIGKYPDAGKDWRQEEKGKTEDEIIGWHHWLNGQGFEQTLGDSEGQEAWCAAVHGSPRVRQYWGIEQQ